MQSTLGLFETIFENDPAYWLGLLDDEPKRKTRKKSKTTVNRPKDMWETTWGRMLLDPMLQVKGSYAYRKFRRRFRVPIEMFYDLVKLAKERNICEQKYDGKIRIEIKILVALRMLGRDLCGDSLDELAEIGESTAIQSTLEFFETMFENDPSYWLGILDEPMLEVNVVRPHAAGPRFVYL